MKKLAVLAVLLLPVLAFAADAAPTPATSALKMTFGLLVVLAIMAGLAWLIRRFAPGRTAQNSVARVVGGVSVGTRERVVVVEVAGRWIVVGVAPGQVRALADLEAGDSQVEQAMSTANTQPFAGWLQRSSEKFHGKK
ncbi:MAG TPA: flagellar biosynthetic protein FliO [Methylovorus sp.]|jgi:flagellar protein FliO/FliZ|nr:flagellar biosynthetic protein FliO [Methylovorus sp.]